MRLDGIHHITCITGNAPGNVDFYTGVLGLRLVKKTVNQDDPTVYHLFYADDAGSPGADITFFEYPGARRGRAGAGMVHTITWRVASVEAIDFWERRLRDTGTRVLGRDERAVRFEDPEGLRLELVVGESQDAPLVAEHPEIPFELALQGFESVRGFARDPDASRVTLTDVLGFAVMGESSWEARGPRRGGRYELTHSTDQGIPGAGTVHHVAWATEVAEQEAWLGRVERAGHRTSGIVDRFWFRSIYFREPSGILFELATVGPGFSIDEDAEHLGEQLILPPAFEHLREQIAPRLTPLPDPRAAWAKRP